MRARFALWVRSGPVRGVAALALALAVAAWPRPLGRATTEAAAMAAQNAATRPVADGRIAGEPAKTGAAPGRVVCLAPSAAEIACALGRADVLVGATLYSDYPEAAARLPRVGSYANPDLERVVALRPDLCLGVAGMTPGACVARLRELGIRTELFDTATLEGVLASVVQAGALLGAEPQGRELADSMRRRMEAVARAVADAPDRPAVLYQIGQAPMHAAGGGTFLDEVVRLAGGRNVCAAMAGYPRLTMEQAVVLAPDVVVVPTMGRDHFDRALARWRDWPEVPAVAAGRIFLLDSDLFDRPGPRLVRGIEEMARLLHPGIDLPRARP